MSHIATSNEGINFKTDGQAFRVTRQGVSLYYWPCDVKNEGNYLAAKKRYDQIADLYRRLCNSKPTPSDLTVNILDWIVNPPSPNHFGIPIPHRNTINALLNRGVICKRKDVIQPYRVHHYEPVYRELEP